LAANSKWTELKQFIKTGNYRQFERQLSSPNAPSINSSTSKSNIKTNSDENNSATSYEMSTRNITSSTDGIVEGAVFGENLSTV
jgi:hypothetical protein